MSTDSMSQQLQTLRASAVGDQSAASTRASPYVYRSVASSTLFSGCASSGHLRRCVRPTVRVLHLNVQLSDDRTCAAVVCAQHHEAWVLIKNGAGTRFLRPASANELRKMTEDPGPDFEVDPITMEPCGKHFPRC